MPAIINGMATFCTGSARQKREYFKKLKDAVFLDNVEVLFCVSENGRNYFAFGDVPFSTFTVEEYLMYSRTLSSAVPTATIRAFGLSPYKRIGKLCPAELRTVAYLEYTGGVTNKQVVIDLDGTGYSRRNNAALKRLLDAAPDAYVCITDNRFLSHAGKGARSLTFGNPQGKKKPAFYAAKKLARRLGARRIAIM